jgi:K+-transporting ATPase ATPase C chain
MKKDRKSSMVKTLKISLVVFALMTFLTGVAYPVLVTVASQLIFPHQANGSLIKQNGQVVGSELIGQQFDQPGYFWGRLSATGGQSYNAAASSGSNYGPLNANLEQQAKDRIAALKSGDPQNSLPIPVDLVTASGSGLDPHISVAAAQYQAGRVALARGMTVENIQDLIDQNTTGRFLGLIGEPRVNVLTLNLALDELK